MCRVISRWEAASCRQRKGQRFLLKHSLPAWLRSWAVRPMCGLYESDSLTRDRFGQYCWLRRNSVQAT